jgi:hypothetical protein
MPGAIVVARNRVATTRAFQSLTNAFGAYELALGAGSYSIEVSRQGFRPARIPDVTVVAGSPARLPAVRLQLASR